MVNRDQTTLWKFGAQRLRFAADVVNDGAMRGVFLLMVMGLAAPVQAQDFSMSSKSRANQLSHRLGVLDSLSATYDHSARLQPEQRKPATAVPRFSGSYRGQYLSMARAAARRHGIPEDLFLRLVQQESAWNPNARSHKGAIGLAQLMPATARSLGVNPNDPYQNLEGGARYLRAQYNKFRSWRLALAAYNAGPGAVERYGGVPPFKETKGYVRAILGAG